MPSIAFNRAPSQTVQREQLEDLNGAPTALLLDAHRAVVGLGSPLLSLGGKSEFAGTALTIGAGSLAQWKALDSATVGQVLVIACGGRRDRAEFGEIFVQIALRKGIAAIVTDGLLRDREAIGLLDIPVFACGSHPASPADPAPGQVGFPANLLGKQICTGDIVVGDADGLAVIPADELPSVLSRIDEQRRREEELAKSVGANFEPGLPPRLQSALQAIPLVDHV